MYGRRQAIGDLSSLMIKRLPTEAARFFRSLPLYLRGNSLCASPLAELPSGANRKAERRDGKDPGAGHVPGILAGLGAAILSGKGD